MFGGQAADTPNGDIPASTTGASRGGEDDESSSLINDAACAGGGVFSKGAEMGSEMMDKLETGPDYKVAAVFLFFSVLFFFAAFTALPFILISPKSFNLYFCFGSIFLQLALAFFYAPMTYLRKLFSEEYRIISIIYITSLLIDLYFIWAGTGYLVSLLLVLMQGGALAYYVMGAIGGAERANSIAYTIAVGTVLNKIKGMMGKGD